MTTTTCPHCHGRGIITTMTSGHVCPTCGGKGYVTKTDAMAGIHTTCPMCHGTGMIAK